MAGGYAPPTPTTRKPNKKEQAGAQTSLTQGQVNQNFTQASDRSTEQYNQGQMGQQIYGEHLAAGIDPNAAGRNRQGFEDTLGETRGMISGISKAPGYSTAEAQKIRVGAIAPVASSFNSAAGQLTNRQATTGNSAGFGPMLAKLARDKAITTSQVSAGVEGGIADARRDDTKFATEAMSALPGVYGAGQSREVQNVERLAQP